MPPDHRRPQTVDLGDLQLTPLLDGYFRLDGGAMFGVVPKPLWEKRAAADERNRITLAMRPLLVRGERLMIIDAGAGDTMDPKSAGIYALDRAENLDVSLARAGVAAEAIEIVLASHLHFDHAGGFTCRDNDGMLRPRFPNARYLVNEGEWDDATHPHERNRASYMPHNFMPLQHGGVIDFTRGDERIMPGVRVRRTGGHTRCHQIVYIESGSRTAVFTADLMPTTAHVDEPWIMAYDLYPMETLAFKRHFVREAIDREYLIFFEHDPKIPAGIIRETNGKKHVEALNLE
jgi:glyoxylase-like metal-dependent hydrolase (beta-lactamase superfamily II)